MRLFTILTLFAYGWVAQIQAQSEPELVRAEFRVLPILTADWTGILYQPAPGEPMVELEFRSLARSFGTYKYEGPDPLRFYRETGTTTEGEPVYTEVGRVPVSSSEMLVFFMKQASGDDPDAPEFSLLAMNDSPDGLPMDHIAFVNFMEIPFRCRFMDENFILEPGIGEPVSLRDHLNEDVFVGLVVQNNDTHRVVLRNNWEFRPGNRHLILLLPQKKAGSFRIRAYRVTDFVGENERFNRNWSPPVLSRND